MPGLRLAVAVMVAVAVVVVTTTTEMAEGVSTVVNDPSQGAWALVNSSRVSDAMFYPGYTSFFDPVGFSAGVVTPDGSLFTVSDQYGVSGPSAPSQAFTVRIGKINSDAAIANSMFTYANSLFDDTLTYNPDPAPVAGYFLGHASTNTTGVLVQGTPSDLLAGFTLMGTATRIGYATNANDFVAGAAGSAREAVPAPSLIECAIVDVVRSPSYASDFVLETCVDVQATENRVFVLSQCQRDGTCYYTQALLDIGFVSVTPTRNRRARGVHIDEGSGNVVLVVTSNPSSGVTVSQVAYCVGYATTIPEPPPAPFCYSGSIDISTEVSDYLAYLPSFNKYLMTAVSVGVLELWVIDPAAMEESGGTGPPPSDVTKLTSFPLLAPYDVLSRFVMSAAHGAFYDSTRDRILVVFLGDLRANARQIVVQDCTTADLVKFECNATPQDLVSISTVAERINGDPGSPWYVKLRRVGADTHLTVWVPALLEAGGAVGLGADLVFGCLEGFLPKSQALTFQAEPCLGCGPGNSSLVADSTLTCTVCGPNTFARATGSLACSPCDNNAYSRTGAAFCLSNPGYMPSLLNPDLMLRCASTRACPGNNVCGEGYTDEACARCAKGYFRKASECEKCPAGSTQALKLLALFVVIMVAFVAFVGIAYVDIKYDLKGKAKVMFTRMRVHLTLLGVFVSYAQVIALLRNVDVEWSPVNETVLDVLSAANFNMDLMAAECSSESFTYTVKFCVGVFGRMFLISLLWVAYGATRQPRARTAAITTTLFMYTGILARALEIFDCTKQLDGSYVLDAEPIRKCYDSTWWILLAIVAGVVVLGYGIGVPVTMFVFRSSAVFDELGMYKLKRSLNMWELVLTARKFFFVGAVMFFSTRPVTAVTLAFIVIAIAAIAHILTWPYGWTQHNVLEAGLLAVTILVLAAAIALAAKDDMSDSAWVFVQAYVGIALIGSFIAILVVLIVSWKTLDFQEYEEETPAPDLAFGVDDLGAAGARESVVVNLDDLDLDLEPAAADDGGVEPTAVAVAPDAGAAVAPDAGAAVAPVVALDAGAADAAVVAADAVALDAGAAVAPDAGAADAPDAGAADAAVVAADGATPTTTTPTTTTSTTTTATGEIATMEPDPKPDTPPPAILDSSDSSA